MRLVKRDRTSVALISAFVVLISACEQTPDEPAATEPAAAALTETVAPPPASPPTGTTASSELAPGFAPIAFDLAESAWLVVAIDGEPLADRFADVATVRFTDAMLYWQGCNHHEGLFVPVGASFAVGPAMASLATCTPGGPDAVMAGILGSRPLIGRNIEGKVMLAAKGHSITLSRIDETSRKLPAPPLDRAPFRLMFEDGAGGAPLLSFSGGTFAVWMDCPAAIGGKTNVRNGRMTTSEVTVAPDCRSHRATAMAALARFFAAGPAIARGANGELLLSDGDTIINARQCHPDPSPCEHAGPAKERGE